jgi:hypothetical protein
MLSCSITTCTIVHLHYLIWISISHISHFQVNQIVAQQSLAVIHVFSLSGPRPPRPHNTLPGQNPARVAWQVPWARPKCMFPRKIAANWNVSSFTISFVPKSTAQDSLTGWHLLLLHSLSFLVSTAFLALQVVGKREGKHASNQSSIACVVSISVPFTLSTPPLRNELTKRMEKIDRCKAKSKKTPQTRD